MSISPRLEQTLKTTQQMILSPQMQQAIQILQMPIMELRAKISEEMDSNPLLEELSTKEDSLETTLSNINNNSTENSDDVQPDAEFKDEFQRLSDLDDEWKNLYKQTSSNIKHTAQDEEKRRFMETSIAHTESLSTHLTQQLNLLELNEADREIGEFLIGSMDKNGYINVPAEQVALSMKCAEEDVERILSKVQKFTPIGVGARDLKECLFLQLNHMNNEDPVIREIIENHLEDIAKRKYPQIAKKLKVPVSKIQESVVFISSLDPKPGRIFGQDTVTYITPDIYIEEKDGEYQIILNDDNIPHLHISNLYKQLMSDSDEVKDETVDYIKNKVRSGMWLIKNIQQRQQTIYNIMKKIVELQKKFFREGIGFLIPLTMQEVASQIGIHESTVSRAISKKYTQTPQGLFPVKFFFSVEMKKSDGGITSARNIKQKIQDTIAKEDPKSPLSDQEIIALLKTEGLELARRTVAKYRKELRIPPSNLRRSY
ncbi:MAG: hypothetical protein ACD_79C00507G0005 [uncultured bacterium]|nr:MAG: hypothetical protein ACD_79C00507G0005 [uncultured bacterium]